MLYAVPAVWQLDPRLTCCVPIELTTLTLFADRRNLFNASNTVDVLLPSGKTRSAVAENTARAASVASLGAEGMVNGVLLPDGSLDLSRGRGACRAWVTAAGASASPNCVYLIGAERRFGNGGQVYTPAEQARASDVYETIRTQLQNVTAPGAGRGWGRR